MSKIENLSATEEEPVTREVQRKGNLKDSDSSATCSTDAASTVPSLHDESDSDDDAPICARCRHMCEGSWFLCDDKVFCSKDCRAGNLSRASKGKPHCAPTPVVQNQAPAPIVWTDPRIGTLSRSAIELNNLLASAGLAPA